MNPNLCAIISPPGEKCGLALLIRKSLSALMSKPVVDGASDVTASLAAFSSAQLADVDIRRIADSTFTLIAVSTFLAGASSEFYCHAKSAEDESAESLEQLIARTFSMDVENAAGLIDSAQRLGGSYRLMEGISESGRLAAGNWIAGEAASHGELKEIVTRCDGLSMVDLGIEGVCEPPAEEALATEAAEQEPVLRPTAKKRKVLRYILLAVLLIGLAEAAVLYYFFA